MAFGYAVFLCVKFTNHRNLFIAVRKP